MRHADGILIELCLFIRNSGGRISLPVKLEPKCRYYGVRVPVVFAHRVKLIMLGPSSVPVHRERTFFHREIGLYKNSGLFSEELRTYNGAFRLMIAMHIYPYPTQRGVNTHPPRLPSPIGLYFRPG